MGGVVQCDGHTSTLLCLQSSIAVVVQQPTNLETCTGSGIPGENLVGKCFRVKIDEEIDSKIAVHIDETFKFKSHRVSSDPAGEAQFDIVLNGKTFSKMSIVKTKKEFHDEPVRVQLPASSSVFEVKTWQDGVETSDMSLKWCSDQEKFRFSSSLAVLKVLPPTIVDAVQSECSDA